MVMDDKDYILNNIISARSYLDVFSDLNAWKEEYKLYVKLIHPDVCDDIRSTEALFKLNNFKEELEIGRTFTDEACNITYTLFSSEFIGDLKIMERNRTNYLKLATLKDEASKHFRLYLPSHMDMLSGGRIKISYPLRAIPISSMAELEQKHVNWVLSRLLEFTCWINQSGFCHAGITPDSVFITPENHGLLCTSFYHLTKLDDRLMTISGKYSEFYPASVLLNKTATSNIDITLSKKIAIWLLGDRSGNGSRLRGKVIDEYLDFLQEIDYDPLESYNRYRDLLKKYFNTKEFHHLKL
jgi:hypothetical protein